VINRIADFQAETAGWRHDLQTHPETAFDEILALGASYWARLAETGLATG